MLNIQDFKSEISSGGGLARTNLFMVELPPGSSIPGAPSNLGARSLNLLCKEASLPGKQVLSTPRQIGMKPVNQAYGYLMDDVSLTFHVLNDYKIKKYFDAWQESAVNTSSNTLNYFNEYVKPVKIRQLSKRSGAQIKIGKTLVLADMLFELFGGDLLTNSQVNNLLSSSNNIYTCQLLDAYPTTVNPIALNNELDGMVELNVQLSYRKWREI
tara:strand:+ start:1 stop:639 length:639 start_codon:yes stop_codon:yes gene_type:complete